MQQGFFRASGMAEGLYSPHHEGGGKLSAQFSREWISSGEREWVTLEKRRRTLDVEVPELRQRSTLSVPPMASQSACTGVDGNQVHTLRSPVPSICGTANRHPSPRVSGSPVVLDDVRSRKEAARFQDLLQQPSHAYLTGRANTRYADVTTNRKSPLVWMAAPLSILISDANGCLTLKYSSSLWYPVRRRKNLE